MIAIAIAGLVFGAEAVQAQIFGTLRGLLGESGTQAIDAMLKGANRPREGLIATIIGVGTLVFAARLAGSAFERSTAASSEASWLASRAHSTASSRSPFGSEPAPCDAGSSSPPSL